MNPAHTRKLLIAFAILAATTGILAWRISRSDTDGFLVPPVSEKAGTPPQSAVNAAFQEDWNKRIAETKAGDFRALIEEAMRIADPKLRDEIIASIIDKWLVEDIQSFTKYWASLEVEGADDKLAILASALEKSLTKLDPERAASDEIFVIVQRLISHLAGTDPDKALEWAKKWLLEDTMEQALVSVARNMAKTDVQKALAVIDDMKSPLRRGQALAAVGGIWAARDLQAASDWARGLINPVERALTMNSVLLVAAKENSASAAAVLQSVAQEINEQYLHERATDLAANGLTEADLANDPDTYREMLESGSISAPYSPDVELMADAGKVIGSKLAETDGTGAVDYADSLATDYLQLKTLVGVLEGWAKTDPVAAVSYLNQNHPINTDLFSSLYASWAAADPAAAAEGTQLVRDPALRSQALETVVGTWGVRGDPQALVHFLGNLPTSEYTDSVRLAAANAISHELPATAWDIAQGISSENVQFRGLKTAFSILVVQDPAHAGRLLGSATTSLPDNTSARLQDMLDAVVGN